MVMYESSKSPVVGNKWVMELSYENDKCEKIPPVRSPSNIAKDILEAPIEHKSFGKKDKLEVEEKFVTVALIESKKYPEILETLNSKSSSWSFSKELGMIKVPEAEESEQKA